ncbi:MAG: hypothetical protein DRN92_01845 [Thermoproteota archaeon]|nr:MAG: hypothetical protein DRN92_01845 [Candidatus Korarchaeota archaeon]
MRKKFTKKVKARLPWLEHVSESPAIGEIIPISHENLKLRAGKNLCLLCRGSKLLCGRPTCPILMKAKVFSEKLNLLESERIEGSSPPAVFVGRIGYPYVRAGPLIPQELGDTSLYDRPEAWFGMSLESILEFRLGLVRGTFPVDVRRPEKAGRLMEGTLEMALSEISVDSETKFKKKPKKIFLLDDEIQPMGPLAPLEDMKIYSIRSDPRMEKAFGDTDLKAQTAVVELYRNGVEVSRIQRAFSVGAFGLKTQRRLVPTRWSITAVDDILGVWLRERYVKDKPFLDEYRVYLLEAYGNKWALIMIPGPWRYESIEAWYPGTTWNPDGESIAFIADYEEHWGRKGYASMGGCYYAARLAVLEKLNEEGRQATVLVLREIHRDSLLPLGVWLVRESVRAALKRRPEKFQDLKDALRLVSSFLNIPLKYWRGISVTLRDISRRQHLEPYLS